MPLEDKIIKIDALKAEFEKAKPLPEERKNALWEKFRLEWNYNSNHIEGNTLTYGETMLLLIFGKTEGGHELREYEEMQAHDTAIKMIEEWASERSRDLTEADIRTLNKVILVKPFWKEAITNDRQTTRRLIKIGEYKEFPNSVLLKTGEMFHYAPPQDTPRLMGELMEGYKKSKAQHPLILASELHYRFIRIHPFDDGNGRVARLLVNYVLMKNNYPPLIVKSKDKENYLTALQKTDSGDLDAFNEYMSEQLIWSLEIANKAAKGESIEEPDDLDKEISIWKKQIENASTDVIPYSNVRVNELYQKGIRQLLKLFIEKHEQFKDVFIISQFIGIVNGRSNLNRGIEYIDEELEKINNENLSSMISNISLQIYFQGFKKNGINAFNIHPNLTIEFRPYSYVIFNDNETLRENSYSDYIDNETSQLIVASAVKKTFDLIKTNTKNK